MNRRSSSRYLTIRKRSHRASVLALSVAMMVVLAIVTAFAIDAGYMCVAKGGLKSQTQRETPNLRRSCAASERRFGQGCQHIRHEIAKNCESASNSNELRLRFQTTKAEARARANAAALAVAWELATKDRLRGALDSMYRNARPMCVEYAGESPVGAVNATVLDTDVNTCLDGDVVIPRIDDLANQSEMIRIVDLARRAMGAQA